MVNSELTCREIIEEVLKGGVARERITQRVFEQYKGFIFAIANKLSVPYDIAADAYIEAISELIIKIQSGKFIPKFSKSCSTFIYTVCYNKCVDYIRREQNRPDYEYINDSDNPDKYELPSKKEHVRLRDILEIYGDRLGDRGRKVLELYMQGYTAKEIATKLGYKNANSVAFTKSKYLRDLRELVKRDMKNDDFPL